MSEAYVRPTTCNGGCGKPRSRPGTFLCSACAPVFDKDEVGGDSDFDDMDELKDMGDGGLGSGKWLFDRDIGGF